MKLIKKLLAVALSAALALMLAIPAFAAGTNGETYTAYKIFEASVLKDENGDPITGTDGKQTVSYTISTSSDWYTTVSTYASNINSGLTLTATAADANTFVVGTTNSFSPSAFAAELAKSTAGKTASGNATASAETTTISVTDGDGYYLITSSLGSICQLITGGTLTIVEKNTVPSIIKKVWEDSTNSYEKSATIDVTDTVKYQLTVNTGTNDANLGTGVDGDYVITDVLPDGFAYSANSIAVAAGNDAWTADTDYTVSYDSSSRKLTITLDADEALGELDKNADIVITYSATVTAAQATIGISGNENTATLTYSKQSIKDTATVYTYEIGGTGENAPFKKVDADDTGKALEGVKFQLSKTVDGTTYYAQVTNNFLSAWTTTKASASDLTTDANGAIDVKGVDAGTYTLTETATLPGYNLLKDTITVEISDEGVVTYKLSSATGNGQNTIEVQNSTGSELPSTGGMGTTVIYTLGILLVLGAGVILVVRRRMNAE